MRRALQAELTRGLATAEFAFGSPPVGAAANAAAALPALPARTVPDAALRWSAYTTISVLDRGPLPRLIGRATDVTPDNVIVQKYLLLRGPGDFAWLAEAELATPALAALYAAYPHKGADPERKGWIRGVTGDNLDARKAQARAAAGRALSKREWLVDFFCSEQPPPAGAPLLGAPTTSATR